MDWLKFLFIDLLKYHHFQDFGTVVGKVDLAGHTTIPPPRLIRFQQPLEYAWHCSHNGLFGWNLGLVLVPAPHRPIPVIDDSVRRVVHPVQQSVKLSSLFYYSASLRKLSYLVFVAGRIWIRHVNGYPTMHYLEVPDTLSRWQRIYFWVSISGNSSLCALLYGSLSTPVTLLCLLEGLLLKTLLVI